MSSVAADVAERLHALADVVGDLLVHHAPEADSPWAPPLLEVVARLGQAAAAVDPEEQLRHVDDATARLRDARSVVDESAELTGVLDEALSFAVAVRIRVIDAAGTRPGALATRSDAPPVRGSRGWPQIHRGVELPAVDVLPRERDFDPSAEAATALAHLRVGVAQVHDWLRAEDDEPTRSRPRRADPFPPPRGTALEVTQLQKLARDALEDIGVLSGLRRMEAELPWSFAEHFEERLLANLDAVVTLDLPRVEGGPRLGVARELWRYLTEWNVPDPGRAFAFAFVLACAEADAGPRWVALTLRQATARLGRAFEDALALGASPAVGPAIASLLQGEDDPRRLLVALRAWRRRGGSDVGPVLPFVAHPDDAIAGVAISTLGDVPSSAADAALHELLAGDPRRATEAACGLARRGDREGMRHLRAVFGSTDPALAEARAIAARTIALLGDPRDADALRVFALGRPEALELLGWHGQPSHLAALLDGLAAEDEEHRRSAAWGLTRLLGRPPGAATDAHGPVRDLASWRARATGVDAAAPARLQRGAPVTSGSTAVPRLADELLAATTLQRDRPQLLLELELAAGRPIPVDLEGWVARQREILGPAREVRGGG